MDSPPKYAKYIVLQVVRHNIMKFAVRVVRKKKKWTAATRVFPTAAGDAREVAEKRPCVANSTEFAFAVDTTGWDPTPSVAPETLMNVNAITRVLSDDGGDVCRAKR